MNGFFGKVQKFFGGKEKAVEAKVNRVPYQRPATRHAATAYGRNTTKGAFGGTGTGRAGRGMPGRKLIKKTVKAGWKAQKRVMPMGKAEPRVGTTTNPTMFGMAVTK